MLKLSFLFTFYISVESPYLDLGGGKILWNIIRHMTGTHKRFSSVTKSVACDHAILFTTH